MKTSRSMPYYSFLIFSIMLIIGGISTFLIPSLSILFYFIPALIIGVLIFYIIKKPASWIGLSLSNLKAVFTSSLLSFISAIFLILLHLLILLAFSFGYLVVSPQCTTDSSFFIVVLIGGILTQLIVAFFEEFIFRGFILSEINETLGMFWAVIISSVMFSFAHIYAVYLLSQKIAFNIAVFLLNMFLGGVILAILRLNKNTLYAPMAFHFAWNFFGYHIFGLLNPQLSFYEFVYTQNIYWVGFEVSILGSLIFAVGILIAYSLRRIEF
ncbi:MAG: CPBP family intramembrane glutamic endopeptidase [Candidatus Asgardarchaeia archaeon]